MENKKTENRVDEELKKIVIARIEIFPSDKKISIGSVGEFTKEEIIKHVERETDIGEKIIEIQFNYLKSLKEGIFYEQNFVNNQTQT